MTEHACWEFNADCYRCELNRDELGIAASETDNWSAEQWRDALEFAYELAVDMRGYVSDYFAEKWGHDEDLAQIREWLGHPPK